MNQKNFANVVLPVIVLILLLAGGYYIFAPKKTIYPPETPIQNGGQTNVASSSSAFDEGDITFYRSKSCGFQIAFPTSFVDWSQPKNTNPKKCPDQAPFSKQVDPLSLKSKSDCAAGIVTRGCNFFEIVVANNKITGPKAEKILVDKIPAEKIITHNGEAGQIIIQVEKNKLWYRYTHTYSPSNAKEAEKLSDSIISTFKFIR